MRPTERNRCSTAMPLARPGLIAEDFMKTSPRRQRAQSRSQKSEVRKSLTILLLISESVLIHDERFTAIAGAGRQPDVWIDTVRDKTGAAVTHEYVDATGMETTCGRDQLPPVTVRSPARAVRGKKMVIPGAPNVPLAPRVSSVAPDRGIKGDQLGRVPVERPESAARVR